MYIKLINDAQLIKELRRSDCWMKMNSVEKKKINGQAKKER